MFGLNPYVLLGAFLALAILTGGSYIKGRTDGIHSLELQIEAERSRALEAALDFNDRETALQNALATAQQEKLAAVRVVYKTIVREVPTHVTPDADARCTVPAGFVLVHNAAVNGLPPAADPAGRPDDAPSGVALSTVAATVADNYGTCAEIRQRLIGWQEWYTRESALWKDRK